MKTQILSIFVIAVLAQSPAHSDSVDEAAKCASTFFVLTSVGMLDEGLGQHFEKLSMLSYDMIGAYARYDRNETNWTNGDTRKLISFYRTEIDHSAANGLAFVPYVKSCTGWTNKVGIHLGESLAAGLSVDEAVSSSPRPSTDYGYPFEDWVGMQEIFSAAYSQWEAMGKISSDNIYNALE